MEKIQLQDNVLEAIEKNLIEKMVKHVKFHQADFIIDLHWLERENKKGFVANKIVVIFRENGCEMNYLNDQRIQSWVSGNCSYYHYFLIDISEANKVDINKLSHYDYLSESGDEYQCIYEVGNKAVTASDFSIELYNRLYDTAREMEANGVTNIKEYEIALQDEIERLWDAKNHELKEWWEITNCDIFTELLGNRPASVANQIVIELK